MWNSSVGRQLYEFPKGHQNLFMLLERVKETHQRGVQVPPLDKVYAVNLNEPALADKLQNIMNMDEWKVYSIEDQVSDVYLDHSYDIQYMKRVRVFVEKKGRYVGIDFWISLDTKPNSAAKPFRVYVFLSSKEAADKKLSGK